MESLEALRRLAGGPKAEAARVVALFLGWAATYSPPTRFGQLEIDGIAAPAVVRAPEEPKLTPIVVTSKCPTCGCQNTGSSSTNLCSHCIFGSPCPAPKPAPTSAPETRFSFLEVD